jgi:WD40 repeat protein
MQYFNGFLYASLNKAPEQGLQKIYTPDREIHSYAANNLSITKKQKLVGHDDKITCLCVYKGELYSGSHDRKIICWNTATSKPKKTMTVPEGRNYYFCLVQIKDLWICYKDLKTCF